MPDIAELGLSIDTRQLEQGAQAMDRLGVASESVEKKVDSATSAIDKLGKASADAKAKTAEGAAAVDAVGEAGARVVQKVDAASASIDAMGATATRIRTVFLGGSNTLDGFMGSSMGVWRSSEAAAAGIDSLGNATERTWKKQADYNGAMADTTRIMRQAADAVRTLEESNHRMLIELQREIDTFGMARGELERYRAAELGLGSAAQMKAAALGNSIDAMHREERAARDAAGAQDRAAQAGDRFIKSLQDQVATLGMTTQQLQTYRAAQLGVSDAASPLINKLAEAGAGAKSAGGHMEGLSFQSASAKRELLVLAHELSQGQFQRFGGSMMVLGEQTGAAGLLFSSTGLAVLGFAAALATVTYAMIKGASTQREMNNALISTNNYAGVTSDKLNELAHAATAVHGSIGEAKKVVTELAGTGKFTGDQIAYITDAVIALETATGESVKKTIKEFESLAVQSTGSTNRATEVITRATVKLDDTYHFLTLSVYEAIRALEKDGDAKGASAVATEAFAKATKDGADQMIANLGSVARAWHGVKEAIGGAMDAIGSYGAKATPAADVKKYSFRLSEFDKGLADSNLRLGRAPDAITPELQATRTKIVLGLTDAVDKLNKADAVAIAQGEVATNNSRAVHAAAMIHAEDIRLQKKGMGELAVALDAYQSNVDAIRAVDPNSPLITPDAIAAGIAARRKAHTEQAKPKIDQVENTAMADHLARIQDDVNLEKERIGQLSKINEMFHKAGRLGDEEYFKNKRDNARAVEQEEINGYTRQIAALKDHQNATGVEMEKNNKKANDLDAKRAAAILRAADAVELTEMEEMLRMDALSEAAVLATNKEIGAINAQIAATEEQIRTYGLLPAQKTALAVADLEEQKAALASFEGNEKVIDGINRKIEALNRLGIVQGKASTQEQVGDVAKAKELLDILTAVDTATKSAAQGMTASFGAVGTAIGGLTTALSGYAVQQQAITAQLAASTKDAHGDPTKIAKAQATAAQRGAQAQIKSYGDMASAAKGFFKENSAGYKVMEGAEKAYRAVEMAMAIESMVKKLFAVEVVTTATLGAEAAKAVAIQAGTATQLAADTVKGTSAAAVAVATQAQGDPYSAWIRMAAMAAAMAALGFAVSGGGRSDTTVADRQAAIGTGSVLGDSKAASESIAKSLGLVEGNTYRDMQISGAMLSSLRNIESNIGNLGALLARTDGAGNAASSVATGTTALGGGLGSAAFAGAGAYGGALLGGALAGVATMGTMGGTLTALGAIAGPLGMAAGALVGAVLGKAVSKLFGTTVSIKDQGLTASAMSLGRIDDGAFVAQSYADVQKKKKAFGVTYSNKSGIKTADLDDDISDQFGLIITGMGDTIRSAADILGQSGAGFNARLDTFVVDLGLISLKGLTGEEAQKKLEAAFSKVGDDMAKFALGSLKDFQAAGEGTYETLVRIANDYATVDAVLGSFNKSFGQVGMASVAAREELLKLSGGLDKFTSQGAFFLENFFTDAEKAATLRTSVNAVLSPLNQGSAVTSIDQFKQLALAQDLTTDAGRKTYASMMAVSQAFVELMRYGDELGVVTKTADEILSERKDLQQQLNEITMSAVQLLDLQRSALDASNRVLFDQIQAAKAVVSAKDALAKAYDREAAAAQTALDKSKSWVATLNALSASMALGSQSTLTPEQKYAEARAQFEKTLAAANAGDTTAQSGLSAAEQAFLTASQVVNASDARYAADYARVVAANNEALKWASAQVDVQQASLDALKAQVSGLITINDSVLTVAQAIANLHAAMGTAAGLGVEFTSAPAVDAPVAFSNAPAPVVFDAMRYSAGSNVGSDALVAEIRALNARLDAQTVEIKGLRADQAKQTGATIQATVESNDKAAQTVVAGVDKSAKASAWAKKVEYSQ